MNHSARRIRLCIIATVPISINAFYGKQLEYLHQKGFDITVVTSPDADFISKLPSFIKGRCVPMIRGMSPLKDLVALFRVIKHVYRGKFDIVQYNSPKAALLGSLASYFCRVPVRLYLMWGIYYTGQKGWRRLLMKWVEKVACFCSTNISPDSQSNCIFAADERLCPSSKITLVGKGSANGIDLERYNDLLYLEKTCMIRNECGIPGDATVVGFLGRLTRDKGINELVKAFELISISEPNTYLLMVGPWEAKNQDLEVSVESLIRDCKRVRWLGYKEDAERYMSIMDIFVLPSYREGFGVVNIEAAAMGLPVVATDVPGARDSVIDGETGLLVPPRNVQELANAIKKLIDDKGIREEMGARGRENAKLYEQKKHWGYIFDHRLTLLRNKGNYHLGNDRRVYYGQKNES
jgi:glycosyltransferase involved in cell wall biosynthesis